MYSELKGKKLLVLGATADEILIINAAKELGIYTICTDNNLDWEKAPAKKFSDEAWDISWADIPKLKQLCLREGVDGIMAGYSEFRINQAIKLSKELGLPFYAEDEEVLKKTFDKSLFKKICRQNNVPVTKDYYIDWTNFEVWAKSIDYPIIVKPVDNAGSRGICSCYSPDELEECINYALSFSTVKDVVIEELVEDSREIIVYYTIADGEVVLSAMCDKYERRINKGFNSLPDAYVYPSMYISSFIKEHNDNVIKAIKAMGMKEGAGNLQGFAKHDGSFVFFEMDYRPGGTNTFLFSEYYSNVSYIKMMIYYSLLGKSLKSELHKEDPYFGGKYGCIFTLLSRDGIIGKLYGEDKLMKDNNIIHTSRYHSLGTEIVLNGSQFPKTFRAYIVGNTMKEIISSIELVQNSIVVEDQNNNNMLFDCFNTALLKDNYKSIT